MTVKVGGLKRLIGLFKNPSPYSTRMLQGLQQKNVYHGTVTQKNIDKRRAANKVARRQRKYNAHR